VLRIDGGMIRFQDRGIERLPAHRRARLGIARTFQKVRLGDQLTVYENVAAGLASRWFARRDGWLSAFRPLSTAAVALASTATLAAPANSLLSNGAAVTTVARGLDTGVFYHAHAPKKATVIFDSIGTGGYNCCSGWTISGPSSVIGAEYWPAIQITPTVSGKVTSVVAGVGYVTGNNSVELAIYADSSGLPGKMLWSADVSNLPVFGATSTMTVTAKVTKVKIKANTPFWVATQTDSNSSNTWDAWNQSTTTNATLAEYNGTSWTNYGSNTAGAVTVYGKVKK